MGSEQTSQANVTPAAANNDVTGAHQHYQSPAATSNSSVAPPLMQTVPPSTDPTAALYSQMVCFLVYF